jgi:hypothetical protein
MNLIILLVRNWVCYWLKMFKVNWVLYRIFRVNWHSKITSMVCTASIWFIDRRQFLFIYQVAINKLYEATEQLQDTPRLLTLRQQLSPCEAEQTQQLSTFRSELTENRRARKLKIQILQNTQVIAV